MIIVGAKGFAKEILEIIHQSNDCGEIAFYDDINKDVGDLMFNKFSIIKSLQQAKLFFSKFGNEFTIGVGSPVLRQMLYQKFLEIGGEFTSTVSSRAVIGSYDITIGAGANILTNSIISNSVKIGKGVIIYYNVIITHDCNIGDFVELSPGAQILGRCTIGSMTHIGANATILPDINIGDNVVIGAGAVVTKNMPSGCVAVGVPARIIK